MVMMHHRGVMLDMGVPVQHEISAPVCFINLTHRFPHVKQSAHIERLCTRSSLYVLKVGAALRHGTPVYAFDPHFLLMKDKGGLPLEIA
jgi:hypothetical protein